MYSDAKRTALGFLLTVAFLPSLALVQPDPASGHRTDLPSDTTITVRTEGSNLEFVPGRIALRNRTRVTIRYINNGTLPHNLVIVWQPDDIDTLGPAASNAAATRYVPLDHRDRLIAWSELTSPGQAVEMSFTMPPPGEYTFVCLFPAYGPGSVFQCWLELK